MAAIEASNDPNQLEEMLFHNDSITDLVKKFEVLKPRRPSLRLSGLNGSFLSSDLTGSTPGTPSFSAGIRSPSLSQSLSSISSASSPLAAQNEDDEPITPRLDKGKGKAIHHEDLSLVGQDGKIIPEPGSAITDEVEGSPTDSR